MRKKLFAILMSAMMMVTFMPAMAFAETVTPVWADDYSYVTVDGTKLAATITLVNDSGENIDGTTEGQKYENWNGLLKAYVTDPTGVEGWTASSIGAKYFYDMSSAKVTHVLDEDHKVGSTLVHGAWKEISYSNMEYTTFESIFKYCTKATARVAVKFTAPKDATNAKNDKVLATSNSVADLKQTTNKNYTLEMLTPNYDTDKKFEAQTFTLPVSVKFAEGTVSTFFLSGAIAPQSYSVKKQTVSVDTVGYHLEGSKNLTVDYDAEEHAVVQEEVPGMTSTYKVLDVAKGQYVAADKIAVKEVGTTTYFMTKAKTAEATGSERAFIASVSAATTPTIKFMDNLNVEPGFDAAKYIEIKQNDPAGLTGKALTAKKAADKKAIAANEALLKEFFNDFYTLEAQKVTNPARVTYKIVGKDLTALTGTERDALMAKYNQMLANFNVSVLTRADFDTTATAFVGATPADGEFVVADEINWVKAPLSKTYKAKTLKKKSKSFYVKAEALAPVSYKVAYGGAKIKINKKTGKVTINKGLKKGTYNVFVTAEASNGTDDSYILKIKVK